MGNTLDRLTLLETFVQIADLGSLSAAARSRDVSQASVSRQLQALENQLGVGLARRSTHQLTLTAEGAALLPRARELLGAWEALAQDIGVAGVEPTGTLRIVGPTGHGPSILAPLAARFTRDFPRVAVDLHLTDGPVDLVAIGADLMVRVGPVVGQELRVRRIGQIRRWLVCRRDLARSPYLDRRRFPTPQMPLVALAPFYGDEFSLMDRSGDTVTVKGDVKVRAQMLAAAYAAVLAGGGAGLLPRWLVEDDVADGRLKRLCPKLEPEALPVHLAFPPGRLRASRAIAFVDYLEQAYAES